MIKPRTYYLTVFEKGYKNHTWFNEKDLAERYVKHVWERYKIYGMVVETVNIDDIVTARFREQTTEKLCEYENQKSR